MNKKFIIYNISLCDINYNFFNIITINLNKLSNSF